MLPLCPFPGAQKAAAAAAAKSPAAREPAEKPASAQLSGKLRQMFNIFDRLV